MAYSDRLVGVPFGVTDDMLMALSGALIERSVISSRGDKSYLVKITRGSSSCPCDSFSYRGRCRHVRELREDLGLFGPVIPEVSSLKPTMSEFSAGISAEEG